MYEHLIHRLLYLFWDWRLGNLGDQFLQSFGFLRDPQAPDEEMNYLFIFYPAGRENSTSWIVLEVGSFRRMEIIVEELEAHGDVCLPRELATLLGKTRLAPTPLA